MAKTFFADMIAKSEIDRASARLEIALSDAAGHVQTVSLSPDALAASSRSPRKPRPPTSLIRDA